MNNNKLKDLLKKINASPEITCANPRSKTCTGCEYNNPKTGDCDTFARKADYLIQQGVIVPTINPGDVVYIDNHPTVVSFLHIEENADIVYVIQFDCDDCTDCPFYEDGHDNYTDEHSCKVMGYIEFTDKDIGVTVFLEKGDEA